MKKPKNRIQKLVAARVELANRKDIANKDFMDGLACDNAEKALAAQQVFSDCLNEINKINLELSKLIPQ